VVGAIDWTGDVGLATGIVSVVLGFLAIMISFVLYRFSVGAQDQARRATAEIANAVSVLDALYSRMYGDLFSLTRDTYADIRKGFLATIETAQLHAEREQEVAAELASAKGQLLEEAKERLNELGPPPQRLAMVETSISELISEALERGRTIDREARLRGLHAVVLAIIDELTRRSGRASADEVLFHGVHYFDQNELRAELVRLRDSGIVTWSTETLMPGTVLTRTTAID
jgi:hypothetical protein